MFFSIHKELISELRYFEAEKNDLEVEDLLYEILGEKPRWKEKIKELEKKIERLTWAWIEIQ